MSDEFPRSTARIGGHPIHPMLVPFPIVCFIGTLISDIAYWRTADILWADFSAWLVTAGLVISVFVVIAGLTDFIGDRRIRTLPQAWIHGVGNAVALVLAIFNGLVHTRDAYGPIPTGLILSALVVLILIVTGWNGWDMVYRRGVSVLPDRRP